MTSLYQFEGFDLSENLSSLANYLNSEAKTQELHEVEHNLFKKLLQMGQSLLCQFIEKIGDGGDNPVIKNNEKLPLHSIKKRNYLSIFGNIEISRAYFWKAGESGVFPLDARLNLPKHLHSYLLDKWIQHRVTEEPYEEAINSICDILDQKVTKRVVQQITYQACQSVENYYQQKDNFQEEASHLIVQADCKGVIMVPKDRPKTKSKEEFTRRAKGASKIGTRKDAVATMDYTIEPLPRRPKDILDGLMSINSNRKKEKTASKKKKTFDIRNKQISGTMFGKEKAFKFLADRLQIRDRTNKKPIYILVDGASSLENGILKEFEKRGWEGRVTACCLDIVHVVEYLWDASTALYGETSFQRFKWVREVLKKILNSQIKAVIKELNNKIEKEKLSKFIVRRLQRSLTYFQNHQHMMDYKRYLKEGFPIASGGIEGVCNNLIKDRTDRSGMQWTKNGAEAVINLRSVQCNKDWESYWQYYIDTQSKELYGEWAA